MPQSQADAQAARNAGIVALAANELAGLWPQVDWESPAAASAIKTVYGGIVAQFGQSAAAVAAQTYDELRATKDLRSDYRATLAPSFPQAAIDKAVDSAFLGRVPADLPSPSTTGNDQPGRLQVVAARPPVRNTTSDLPVEQRVPARLDSSLQRHVMQPARDTVPLNVAADPEKPRYVRVPRGATTCAFCVMLASRDLAVVLGKEIDMTYRAANVKHDEQTGRLHVFAENGSKFHDHCDCEAVPIFGGVGAGGIEDVSPNFADYQDMYYKAAADAGTHRDAKKILASMRKLHGLK